MLEKYKLKQLWVQSKSARHKGRGNSFITTQASSPQRVHLQTTHKKLHLEKPHPLQSQANTSFCAHFSKCSQRFAYRLIWWRQFLRFPFHRSLGLRQVGNKTKQNHPAHPVTQVQSPWPTWWKERTASCELSSRLHTHTMACTNPGHTHTK